MFTKGIAIGLYFALTLFTTLYTGVYYTGIQRSFADSYGVFLTYYCENIEMIETN